MRDPGYHLIGENFCVKFSETAQMFDLFDLGMVKLDYRR